MSSINLKEFNNLSRSHNYFMTNDRSKGFPTMQENSLILKRILETRDSNSSDKIYNFKTVKPRKYVKNINPENQSYNTISKVRLIYHQLYPHNNTISKGPFNHHRYHRKNNIRNISYNIDNQNIISPYENNYVIKVNKNLKMPKFHKGHMKKMITSPEISNYAFSNSNINDSDNEIHTLSFKGSKFFANSFFGLNNDSLAVSPDKNNINNSNITKGIELFRNYDELKKKKEEIIQRKMKKNLSPKIEENLKKEKDKDLKEKTINIKLQKFEPKNENEKKMKLIPLIKNKDGIFNMKKIKPRFNSNDTSPNKKQNNANPINNNNERIIINKSLQKDPNKINIIINNKVNNSNNAIFSKGINQSNIIKVSNSSTEIKNNNSTIYTKKNYKTNNIFISKYCSPQKMTENNKIKENSETIRKKYENSENQDKGQMPYNIKTYSPYPPDILTNPYRFIIPSKKFVEDYSSRTPTFLYSDDKKIYIKVHIIPNLEETFLGRKKTKEKLKMQRVISIYFINENDNDNDKGLNLIRNKIKKNNKDLNNNALSAIKEEEEKSKMEPELLMKKDEFQNDIKINTKLEYKPEPESEAISKIDKKEEKEEKSETNKFKNEEKNNNDININEIFNIKENENKEKLNPTNNDYELENNKIKINIKDNNKKEEKKLDYGDELLKTEPKVEIKRFFRRRFDKSNKPEAKPEIKEKEEKEKEKEKEQDKNQSQIKERSFRRIFERNKNTLKQYELTNNTDQKIEIKERPNNNRKYETLNKRSEAELLTSNSKNDIKRGYFINNNFDKKEEKLIDEYGNKIMKTEPIKVIEQKPNFRASFRRRFDKLKNEISMTDAGKNETKEIDKNYRRRFVKQKIESDSQLIKNKNKNDIKEKDSKTLDSKIRRRFQYSSPGNNIESIKKEEKIETNENKYRRRFQKNEPRLEAEIKIEIKDEQKEKKNYEKGYRTRFKNQTYPENNSQLIKDEKKAGTNEKQKTESNIRKRYVRHFGNKK